MFLKSLILVSVLALLSCEEDVNWFDEKTEDSGIFSESDTISNLKPEKKTQADNAEISEKLLRNTVTVVVEDNQGNEFQGSGVFIESNLIATNFHVVENSISIMVKLSDEEDFKLVKVHKLDPIHDIAILKLSNKIKHEFLKFESKKVKVGTEILVAGTPIGFEGTLSDGIVSSIRKEEPYDFDLIQITAPISHGSSGGPVINKKGNLIGISKSGIDSDVAQNINFAVPSKYIEFLLK